MGKRRVGELWTLVVAGSAACMLLARGTPAHGSDELDPTFGVDGIIVSDLPHTGSANALLQQPDQHLVAVGVGVSSGRRWAYLERRDANGALDASFGMYGRVNGPRVEDVWAASLDPAGRFVTFGGPVFFGDPPAVVARYLADGSVDSAFGENGTTSAFLGSAHGAFVDGLVQPDGKIVGVAQRSYPEASAIVRFMPDGTPDPAFGTDGVVSPAAGVWLGATGRQPDGRLVAAGALRGGATEPLVVVRLQEDGALDPTFGNDGVAIVALAEGRESARKVIVLPDGRIVVLAVGHPAVGYWPSIVVARLLPDGAPDPSFGSGGRVVNAVDQYAEASAIVADPDGRLVVAGQAYFGNEFGGDLKVVLLRHLTDGSLDPSFGSGGIVSTAVGLDSGARGLVRQADGKLVVAGFTTDTTTRLFLARYYADGSPTPTSTTTSSTSVPTTTLPGCTCANPCEACDVEGQCRVPREAGCVQARSRGSKLVVQRGGTPARDRLSWTWRSPEGLGLEGFGDPTSSDGFTFCVFERDDVHGVARLVASIPGDALCGDRPCWTSKRWGYRYHDPAGGHDGIRKVTMTATSAGRVTAIVRGVGDALGLPSLDFAFPVTARLVRAGAPECWEATSTNAHRMDAAHLIAISD